MLENIGLGIMTETPCVVVNVQRGSPSTGLPTLCAQADMMQARWGAHGDYEIIAYVPNSPQECFDLTIQAFYMSEKYRLPVFVLADGFVGHMTEKVTVPPADAIVPVSRRRPVCGPDGYLPYQPDADGVPPMASFGEGYRIHATGLTHDERGYPDTSAPAHQKLIVRLKDKILRHMDDIVRVEKTHLDNARIAVVSYGVTSRIVAQTVCRARKEGLHIGHLRLIGVWPFPDQVLETYCDTITHWFVPEINMGQIVNEVKRVVAGRAPVISVPHAGGDIPTAQQLFERIKERL